MPANKTVNQWREEVTRSLVHIDDKLNEINGTVKDHERRIRKLERWVWMTTGAAAAGGGLVGSIFGAGVLGG